VSDPIDSKALDEYLKVGSVISQRYRELGSDDVPPELDRRVLEEARAAVAGGSGARARSWLRWSAPLAVAASVVLVVTVVIESGVQNDASFATQQVAADEARVEQQRQVEKPKLREIAQQPAQERSSQFALEPPAVMAPQAPAAPAPAAAPADALAKAEPTRLNSAAPEEVRVDAKALRGEVSEVPTPVTAANSESYDSPAPQIAAELPAPSRAGSVATSSAHKEAERAPAEADSAEDALSSASSSGTRVRRAVRTAGPRGTMSGSALSSETRPAADEDAEQADLRSDPQKWLESIRELRRTGKVEEADRAWQEFHEAFPNFPVADDDLARKQR
jgi:hypothetical protein